MGKFASKKKNLAWVPLVQTLTVLVTLALLLALGYLAAQKYVYFCGLRPVLLAGDEVDLRDTRMSVEEYETLSQRLPDSEILWSVPVGGQYFESKSEHIILDSLSEDDIPAFSYFENLKTVNAMKCTDHGALKKLEEAVPGVAVSWAIHLDGQVWERDAETVDLRNAKADFDQLQECLGYFEPGAVVRLADSALTQQELTALKDAFPELEISWGVDLMGKTWLSTETKLSFAGESVDVAALINAAEQFSGVEEIDLTGCGCTLDELTAIYEAFGGPVLRGELTLHGTQISLDAEEIDLSGIQMENTEAVEQVVKLMPKLKKVIMSDCGIPDEMMDELNRRHEDIQFVWTVYFSVYSLQTDAKAFCASNLPENDYIAYKLNNEQLEPLKYCTELIALDLGHMRYTDLSFLENMDKLQYLILVDARYSDISVIAQMEELFYLELFKNELEDLTPLLQCKNLKHLNIGYTRGFDPSPLKEMTWLERLWFPGHNLSKEQKQEIIDALPDTEVYMPNWDADGSTGGGWREVDVYYEMRNLFDMFYQPGGTGMDNN